MARLFTNIKSEKVEYNITLFHSDHKFKTGKTGIFSVVPVTPSWMNKALSFILFTRDRIRFNLCVF